METKKELPKVKCSDGHTLGIDNGQYADCDVCKMWDACLAASHNLKQKPIEKQLKQKEPITINMEEILKQLRTMLTCEKFIVTGSLALKVYGLVKKADDIDIILVNPTRETKEMIVRFQDKMPAQSKAQIANEQYSDHSLLAIFKWNGVKIDVFESTGEETLNIDGFEYAMILNIVKAKQQAGRLKDWLQLGRLSSLFWTREGMAKWLKEQENKVC